MEQLTISAHLLTLLVSRVIAHEAIWWWKVTLKYPTRIFGDSEEFDHHLHWSLIVWDVVTGEE